MAEQQRGTPFPPNLTDVMSMWMYAEPMQGSERRPNFRVRVMQNVPRLQVKTNVPEDKNNGRIDFNTDLPTWSVICNHIIKFAEGKLEGSMSWEYNDHLFINGKRSDNPMTLATCKVGKDRDTGKIYIAILGHQRPKVQFFFGPSKYHAMKLGDGTELSEEQVSCAYAVGFAKAMFQVVNDLLVHTFNPDAKNVAKAPAQQGGQGGQNSYGGGNRGGGGYSNNNNRGGGGGNNNQSAPKNNSTESVRDFDDFDDGF